MRTMILAAATLLIIAAMPAQADSGPSVCDTAAEDAITAATGSCGGTVEPWMCIGGGGTSRTVSAGGYSVVVLICNPPPGTIPPVG